MLQMTELSEFDSNPWHVETLDAFIYICCPECTYKSKESINFKTHAIENHPLSADLFSKAGKEIKEELPDFNIYHSEGPGPNQEDFADLQLQDSIDRNHEVKDVKVDCDVLIQNKDPAADLDLDEFDNDNDDWKMEDNDDEDDEDYIEEQPLVKRKRGRPAGVPNSAYANSRHECTLCPEVFKRKVDLRSHKKQHANEPVQCDGCGEELENRSKLRIHKYKKHKDTKCEECDKFFSKAVYWKHVKRVHESRFKEEGDVPSASASGSGSGSGASSERICPKCNETVTSKYFVLHYRTAHGEYPPELDHRRKFICDQCSAEFLKACSLQKHITAKHGEKDSKVYRCHECCQDFNKMQYLMVHYR